MAYADLDYSTSFAARSFPIGMAIEGTAGYGYRAWGKTEHFLYGYLRASGKYRTSVLSNAIQGQIEIFPLSFLGLSFGRLWDHLAINPPYMDCAIVQCTGFFNANYFNLKAFFGLPVGWAGALSYERVFYDTQATSRPLASPKLGLLLSPQGEITTQWDGFAGYRFSDEWTAGIHLELTALDKSFAYQNSEFLVVRKSFFPWSVAIGGGRFESSYLGVGTASIVHVSWTGVKRLGIGF